MNQPASWRDLAAQAHPGTATGPSPAVTWRGLAGQAAAPSVAGADPASTHPAPAAAPGATPPGAPPPPAPTAPPGWTWDPARGWTGPPPEPPAQPAPVNEPLTAPNLTGPDAQPVQGWDDPAAQGLSPATPHQYAPSSSAPEDPAEAAAALGMHIAGAGGAATDVDVNQLYAHIKRLEEQFASLQQSQAHVQAPEVVKYATALADHLQAKADANPVVNADPDHTWYPALVKAAQLVNGAEQAIATGTGHSELVTLAKDVAGWVRQHARRFPAIDYDYVLQLAEETAGAAVKAASFL